MGEGLGSGVQVEGGIQVGGGCSGGGCSRGGGVVGSCGVSCSGGGGGCSGGGGGFSAGGEQRGKRWGGGGELNRIFLQLEFRFRNGLGRLLASQSFNITHLINAELLAKFCTTR